METRLGIWEHFKGDRYEVLGEAIEHETQVVMVIYKPLNDTQWYARSRESFNEMLPLSGPDRIPRFRWLRD